MITGIVLAGGRASRFGGDKLVVVLGEAPVLHRAMRAVAQVADELVVVLAPGVRVPDLPPDLPVPVAVARDAVPGRGPLAGLAAGLAAAAVEPAAAAVDVPRIALVVGGDMPWLAPSVLRLMAGRLAADEATAAMTLGASSAPPLPLAVRSAAALAAAEACLAAGRRSLRSLLDALPSAALPEGEWRALDSEGRTLWDVDVPADLLRG